MTTIDGNADIQSSRSCTTSTKEDKTNNNNDGVITDNLYYLNEKCHVGAPIINVQTNFQTTN